MRFLAGAVFALLTPLLSILALAGAMTHGATGMTALGLGVLGYGRDVMRQPARGFLVDAGPARQSGRIVCMECAHLPDRAEVAGHEE